MPKKPQPKPQAPLAEVEVLKPEAAASGQLVDINAAFSTTRQYAQELHALGRRVNHISILLGAELLRVKTVLNIGRGGDRKSKPQNAGLKWEEIVKQQTGLSADTCDRLMKLAEAGKRFIPVLTDPDVVEKPFSDLPEDRQKAIRQAIAKVSDGSTMQQLMLDFGVVKAKKPNLPPKGGKSAKNKFQGGNAAGDSESEPESEASMAEVLKETALDHLNGETGIIAMRDGGAWQHLEDEDLWALDNALDGWRQLIKAHGNDRETAAAKSQAKGKAKP